jgi:hypothetical protein
MAAMVATSGFLWWMHPRRRARRLLSRARDKALTALEDGDRVRVRGIARRREAGLTSPFTGRPCIGFRATIEQRGETGGWDEILSREDCLPFDLFASGVAARVEGPFLFGLEVDVRRELDGAPSSVAPAALESFGPSLLEVLGRGLRLRFCEAALEHEQPISVLGRASVSIDPGGWRGSLRGVPIKRVIRGTREEPIVLGDEERPAAALSGG